jgi:outer membrane murein-binding lipoprotein Lpp
MPINDFNRALRSHSPLAEETKRKTFGTVRDSRDIGRRSRPRRSTTPSRLFDPTRTLGYFDWTGLSPRPASSHARDSGAYAGIDAQGPIGFAVTSGSHPNRRSRSLSQLRDAAEHHGVRRRSDEIRYWRESYPSYDPDAMSPMSSQHRPEGDSRRATQDGNASQKPETPEVPQPFNFGPLGEMSGMKITQAASLETRVSTLEARLERMEKAMENLHDRISVSKLPLRDSPSTSRPRADSSDQSLPRHPPNRIYLQTHNPQPEASYRMQNHSYESSRPSTTSTQPSQYQSYEELSPRPTYLASPEPTSEAPLLRSNLSARHSESMGRPLSTSTTIRGIASSSPDRTISLSKNGSLTAHHYSALLNLITAEQTARQTLEAQVASLQQQVQSLLSQSQSGGNRASVIYHRSDQLPSRKTMGAAEFSSFEHEESGTESEDEMSYGGEHEEVYGTPSEERGNYAGHDEYEDELAEMETQGEPRTLSLSQLTMGKSALASAGF